MKSNYETEQRIMPSVDSCVINVACDLTFLHISIDVKIKQVVLLIFGTFSSFKDTNVSKQIRYVFLKQIVLCKKRHQVLFFEEYET